MVVLPKLGVKRFGHDFNRDWRVLTAGAADRAEQIEFIENHSSVQFVIDFPWGYSGAHEFLSQINNTKNVIGLSIRDESAITEIIYDFYWIKCFLSGIDRLSVDMSRFIDLELFCGKLGRSDCMISECKKIRSFKLFGPGEKIQLGDWFHFKELEEVEFYYTKIKNFDFIRSLRNLERITVERCNALTDLSGVQSMANLQCLRVDRCKNLSNISGISGAENITDIFLTNCGDVGGLSEISNLKKVEFLNLNGTSVGNDEYLEFQSMITEENLFCDFRK